MMFASAGYCKCCHIASLIVMQDVCIVPENIHSERSTEGEGREISLGDRGLNFQFPLWGRYGYFLE
jgi:hypothetical protein